MLQFLQVSLFSDMVSAIFILKDSVLELILHYF